MNRDILENYIPYNIYYGKLRYFKKFFSLIDDWIRFLVSQYNDTRGFLHSRVSKRITRILIEKKNEKNFKNFDVELFTDT